MTIVYICSDMKTTTVAPGIYEETKKITHFTFIVKRVNKRVIKKNPKRQILTDSLGSFIDHPIQYGECDFSSSTEVSKKVLLHTQTPPEATASYEENTR